MYTLCSSLLHDRIFLVDLRQSLSTCMPPNTDRKILPSARFGSTWFGSGYTTHICVVHIWGCEVFKTGRAFENYKTSRCQALFVSQFPPLCYCHDWVATQDKQSVQPLPNKFSAHIQYFVRVYDNVFLSLSSRLNSDALPSNFVKISLTVSTLRPTRSRSLA